MPTTANRGYIYPASTDDVRPHEDIQALAEDVDADVDAIAKVPVGRIVASGTQALADNTQVPIQFSAADDIDTHGDHNPASNNTRVTPTTPGYYRFYGTAFFNEQTTPNVLDANFRKNGATQLAPAGRTPGNSLHPTTCFTTVVQAMNGTTDYMELLARQDSGGADTTNSSAQFTSVVEWQWLRPL